MHKFWSWFAGCFHLLWLFFLYLLTPLVGFSIILPHAPITAPEDSEQTLRVPLQLLHPILRGHTALTGSTHPNHSGSGVLALPAQTLTCQSLVSAQAVKYNHELKVFREKSSQDVRAWICNLTAYKTSQKGKNP